jgi:hypothetical protein
MRDGEVGGARAVETRKGGRGQWTEKARKKRRRLSKSERAEQRRTDRGRQEEEEENEGEEAGVGEDRETRVKRRVREEDDDDDSAGDVLDVGMCPARARERIRISRFPAPNKHRDRAGPDTSWGGAAFG